MAILPQICILARWFQILRWKAMEIWIYRLARRLSGPALESYKILTTNVHLASWLSYKELKKNSEAFTTVLDGSQVDLRVRCKGLMQTTIDVALIYSPKITIIDQQGEPTRGVFREIFAVSMQFGAQVKEKYSFFLWTCTLFITWACRGQPGTLAASSSNLKLSWALQHLYCLLARVSGAPAHCPPQPSVGERKGEKGSMVLLT